jgi:hypothetical protein
VVALITADSFVRGADGASIKGRSGLHCVW